MQQAVSRVTAMLSAVPASPAEGGHGDTGQGEDATC